MDTNRLRKRFEKKLRKHQHIVEKETDVKCLETPTKNLAICNVGQVNGLTELAIIEIFGKFGSIESIVLLPGKSCSFISYQNVESAIEAFENHNGQLKIAQNDKPVFLSFVETLPVINESKIWNQLPPGLFVLESFISEDEEKKLLSLCKFDDPATEYNMLKHRRVKHFGYKFQYAINNVDRKLPLPEKLPNECDFLWERLNTNNLQPIRNFCPNQLTINCYEPGQGIAPHIDTHRAFEDPIISLSLKSAVVMEFKKDKNHFCILLPPRSLAIMSGECRYSWTHAIIPRKFDTIYTSNKGYDTLIRGTRISFVFRKVLEGNKCCCNDKSNCDAIKKQVINNKIEENTAVKLESQHVHEVYENIASHFSDTRHKPWPNVLNFVQSFDLGSVLLDVGCGNGKYLGWNQNIFQIGCDTSYSLIEVCKERGFEAFTGNCLNIPFKDESVDGALSIAVIHHLANENRRLQAITELVRVLRINGKALIYVWAKDQLKNNMKSSYIKQDRKQRKSASDYEGIMMSGCNQEEEKEEEVVVATGVSLPVHTNRTQFKHNDLLVPWKLRNNSGNSDEEKKMFLRFYHVFEEGELELLCKQVPKVNVIKSFYDQGNCCVILEKNQ